MFNPSEHTDFLPVVTIGLQLILHYGRETFTMARERAKIPLHFDFPFHK